MHSWDFSDKSRSIKGLVVCWMLLNLRSFVVLEYFLPLQADDALDSLDDQIQIEGGKVSVT